MIDLVPSSSTLNASPPEVLREPDSSFAVIMKEVAEPAVMVATGVPIDFVASVVSAVGGESEKTVYEDFFCEQQWSAYVSMLVARMRPEVQ